MRKEILQQANSAQDFGYMSERQLKLAERAILERVTAAVLAANFEAGMWMLRELEHETKSEGE